MLLFMRMMFTIASSDVLRREQCWLAESQAALESSNAYVAAHGLSLARHRMF